LPENLTVGGWLDLTGCTGLTSLPENLTVGGRVFQSDAGQITGNRNYKRLHNGDYVEGKYLYADGILTHIRKAKKSGLYTLYTGKIKGRNVVSDGKYYAHCDRFSDGIKDIEFKKARDRGSEQYRNLTLDSIVKKDDAVTMYRIITGACRQGTQQFLDNMTGFKEEYTVSEIIELTRGQFGSETFAGFFGGTE
ncbi:MAG: hypothetical protein K2N49_05490, partial [Ruminococcus sp.]|nr:hypothetical protein [Ruminococcus sp.]